MSFLEWWGESYNPGPTGSVELGRSKRPPRSNGAILVRFIFTVMIVGGLYLLLFTKMYEPSLKNLAMTTSILLVYCIIAYLVRPEPDTSNIGWLGGVMDDPFRYSDDINRFLLFLKAFLLPGVFLAESIIDATRLIRS
jgi:hypothetical protein